jgi:hypothetical protein
VTIDNDQANEPTHEKDLDRDSQKPDAQDKDTAERVEKQDVTKETTGSENPSGSASSTVTKTADVRSNR